jgi:hypothetical protein
VDRADRWRATRDVLDFSANRRAICAFAQTEDRQKNNMLELAEILTLRHNIDIVDNISGSVKR